MGRGVNVEFHIHTSPSDFHDIALLRLNNRISEVLHVAKVSYSNFHWSMIEGQWKPNGEQREFPDMLIFLKESEKSKRSSLAIPVELKTGNYSSGDKHDALVQMYGGLLFAEERLDVPVNYGIIATTLDARAFHYDIVNRDDIERVGARPAHGRRH